MRPTLRNSRDHSSGNGNQADLAHLSSPAQSAQPQHAVAQLSDGSGMPDYGFGRCDGHHEMVDFGLREKAPLRTGLRV